MFPTSGFVKAPVRRGHALRELERIRKDNEWGIEALEEEEREGEG